MKRYYSGDRSRKFWKKINKYNDKKYHLYRLGCQLQNLEEQILAVLEHKERGEE